MIRAAHPEPMRRAPTPASRWAAPIAAISVGLGALPGVPLASASESLDSARTIYEMGREAHDSGDFETAAALFARADALEPSEVALVAALRAVLKADAPVLGIELAERAERAEAGKPLRELAAVARQRFEARVGTLHVECPGCDVTIDGNAAEPGEHRVETGHHLVILTRGEQSERTLAQVGADAPARVRASWVAVAPGPDAPGAGTPSDAKAEPGGLGRGWFWATAGVTAALAVATTASGIDTMRQYKAFRDAPSPERSETGEAAQQRTQILLGVTGAALLTTAAVGLFGVEWSPERRAVEAAVGFVPGGGVSTVRVAF